MGSPDHHVTHPLEKPPTTTKTETGEGLRGRLDPGEQRARDAALPARGSAGARGEEATPPGAWVGVCVDVYICGCVGVGLVSGMCVGLVLFISHAPSPATIQQQTPPKPKHTKTNHRSRTSTASWTCSTTRPTSSRRARASTRQVTTCKQARMRTR